MAIPPAAPEADGRLPRARDGGAARWRIWGRPVLRWPPVRPGRGGWRAFLVALGLLAVNAIAVSSLLGFVHKPRRVLETDHYYYLAMAESDEARAPSVQAHIAPYCWRVLTPFLARQLARLGLSIHQAFYLLTNVFLCGFLVALFGYLRALGFLEREALLGMVLVGLMPGAVRWYEYQYWMTDPLALLLVCASLLCIESGRERLLLPLAVLGVLTRESFLLVLVYYAVRCLQRSGLRAAVLRTLALAVAPVAVLLLLHALITPEPGPRLLKVIREIVAFRVSALWENQLYLATIGTFGVLLPLVFHEPALTLERIRRWPAAAALLLATYLTLFFGNNTDRLLAYAAPVVVAAALLGLRIPAFSRDPTRLATWSAAAVALQILFWWTTPFHREAVSVYQPTNWPNVVTLLAFWALGWHLWRRPASALAAGCAPAKG
jgi:hypothetical protein